MPTADEKALAGLALHPDDVEARRVYADRLLERGDPLGELINLQCEREGRRSPAQKAREERLRTLVTDRLEAASGSRAELAWRLGFIESVDLEVTGLTDTTPAKALVAEPAARLLRSIAFTGLVDDGRGDLEPALEALAASAAAFPCLTTLRVELGMNLGSPWLEGPLRVGRLSGLWPAFPALEHLELHADGHRFGRLALNRLHTFAASNLPASAVEELREAQWPSLTSLELHFGPQRGAVLDPALATLIEGELSPKVTRLSVAAAEGAMPFLCRHLPRSRLARHAKILGFHHARVDADAAEALISQRAALARFDAVELPQWRVEPAVKASLDRVLGPKLRWSA